jgi:hypothetical protein
MFIQGRGAMYSVRSYKELTGAGRSNDRVSELKRIANRWEETLDEPFDRQSGAARLFGALYRGSEARRGSVISKKGDGWQVSGARWRWRGLAELLLQRSRRIRLAVR